MDSYEPCWCTYAYDSILECEVYLREGKRRQAEEVPPQKGPPLPGIKHDLKAFRNKFKLFTNHYIETSQDEGMLLTKAYIMNWLEKYFCEATY